MPVIEVKSNRDLPDTIKTKLSEGFIQAFVSANEEPISHNLLINITDHQYINFRGNDTEPAALVKIHPGYMSPKEDYGDLVKYFFKALNEVLPDIPADRIYITISSIDYWGWNNLYIKQD